MGGLIVWFIQNDSAETGGGNPQPPNPPPPPPAYSRVRTGQISLNPYLSWELDLIGAGAAEAVFTYIHEPASTLLIFGNAEAAGYDFTRAGVFLVAMDIHGVTRENGFFSFGEPTDRLKAVTAAEGGFLLAVQPAAAPPYLLLVAHNGNQLRRIDEFLNAAEEIHSIRRYADGYLLFTRPRNALSGIAGLRAVFFDRGFSFEGSTLADSTHSLEPVEIFVRSGLPIVFATAVSSLRSLPAIIELPLRGTSRITFKEDFVAPLIGVTIHDGLFLMLLALEGSTLIHLNMRFEIAGTPRRISMLRPVFFDHCYIDGDYFVVWFETSGLVLNNNLTNVATIPAFTPNNISFVRQSVIFAGTALRASGGTGDTDGAAQKIVTVNIFHQGTLIYSAPIGEGGSPLIALSPRHIVCVFVRNGTIMIAGLRYPLFL